MVNKLIQSKSFWILVGLVGVVLLYCYTPLTILLDQDTLVSELNMAGAWGVCLFVVAHVVANVVGLPGSILVIAGGAVFGVVVGTLSSVIGATLGAIAAFYLARYFLHDWVEYRLGHHRALQRLKQMVSCHAFNCVLMLRFAPITPFNLINFLFGLTPIGIKPYAFGTCLGIIPGTLVYTWLGAAGAQALHGEGVVSLALALTALAGLSVLPIVVKKMRFQ